MRWASSFFGSWNWDTLVLMQINGLSVKLAVAVVLWNAIQCILVVHFMLCSAMCTHRRGIGLAWLTSKIVYGVHLSVLRTEELLTPLTLPEVNNLISTFMWTVPWTHSMFILIDSIIMFPVRSKYISCVQKKSQRFFSTTADHHTNVLLLQ